MGVSMYAHIAISQNFIAAISTKGAQPFIDNILKPAGGWNTISEITGWSQEGYNINNAMKKVHVDFWKNALVRISVGQDWEDTTKNVMQVRA